jgi:hypothetical protein
MLFFPVESHMAAASKWEPQLNRPSHARLLPTLFSARGQMGFALSDWPLEILHTVNKRRLVIIETLATAKVITTRRRFT